MASIQCQFPGCLFKAENPSEAIALAMFNSHLLSHSQPARPPAHTQRLPPIPRPEIKQDISEEDWDSFIAEWENFKRCTAMPDEQLADQLYQCCEKNLSRLLIREQPNIVSKGEAELLAGMKRLAVIKIATSVRRTNLITSKQSSGETFREFYANVKAAASICNFKVKCPHGCCATNTLVDYTSSVVKDVLIAGIADPEVRKDVLSWEELDTKDDKAVVAFVESKEIAINAWAGTQTSGTAGVSNYRKNLRPENEKTDQSLKSKLALKGKCTKCKNDISLYKRYQSGKVNNRPFTMCQKCHKEDRNTPKSDNNSMSNEQASTAVVESFFIGGIEGLTTRAASANTQFNTSNKTANETEVTSDNQPSVNAIVLEHHIFTCEGWKRASAAPHPTLRLRMTTHQEDYDQFGVALPRIQPKFIEVIVDSGAQSCLWSRREFLRSGFCQKDLIPVRHVMKAANTAPITIDGAIFIRLAGSSHNGKALEAAVMAYVSPDADSFFLSRESMIQLGIIDKGFPKLGAASTDETQVLASATDEAQTEQSAYADCGCLKRETPSERLTDLPFPCTPENSDAMKTWLLKRYASSSFNKCPHQKLPTMEGPPIQIHVDQKATPIAFRKPAPVPLHWQEQVEKDLLRDVELDVIERIPLGEPTKWCFKMVVTRKDDGSPRRTVDISPMNKHCERELHTSRSPFSLARSVPENSVKTVFDAWNGYHSVPIRVEDRHLTTFTTPWGLFRYKRAPQGFLSSGDGYNRRFDDLTGDIQRMERCVDDTLIHDTSLEEHWWRAIEFIELCGRAGIVLNPEKFQFAQSTVDFAGFRITTDSVEPLPKYLDAIKGFPTPKNITDIRSWFGLVNQVSHYSQLRDMMTPFREFLSPNVRFEWTDELDTLFQESKARIVQAIHEGVKIFDVNKRTCLRTDWSKKGIGYFLSQKHCNCEASRSYGCCPDGWKITLAGSRFLSAAEKNYAPVEGEALAVAWALEHTRFFTMGCNDLIVIVDHKPLTKLFGDRRLDEIENPRLFRLKRRTLMWRFEIEYQRGASNPFADAMSRYPNEYAELASFAMMSDHDTKEMTYIMGVLSEVNTFFAVTWEKVQKESEKDDVMRLLSGYIQNGFPESRSKLPENTRCFWDIREDLRGADGVILFKDRIVIPASLRDRIVENLHSAHQGVSSMLSRAQSIVFWPGLAADVEEARRTCRACNRNAPSQPKLPPTAPVIPTTPFQMIFSDYCQLKGKSFLVMGDRLSGWTEVLRVKDDLATAGAKGLCEALRKMFAHFGVPEELSSDGGPEFAARETTDFLNRWGVKHRLSSAYFPQSNGRAEVAVKVTKRLLEDNIGEDGSLNNDKMVRALLQQRNTPDRDCKLSPAEVLFGRDLRDAMPQLSKSVSIHDSDQIHNQWHQAWAAKEDAIRSRLVRTCEQLEKGSKELPPLREGDKVFLQNQNTSSGRPNKWDRQGSIIATKDNDQYLVKVDGSGRLTLRNRRFLRKFELRSEHILDVQSYPHLERNQPASLNEPTTTAVEGTQQQARSAIVPQPTGLPRQQDRRAHSASFPGDVVGDAVGDAVDDDMVGDAVDQPEVIVRADEHGAGNGGSEDALDIQGASAPLPQAPDQLRATRAPGRPRKRCNFNFAPLVPRVPAQQQPTLSSAHDSQSHKQRGPIETVQTEETDVRQSSRARKQRQIYDAHTGDSVDPRR